MNHLAQLPAVSMINGGNGINKPVIRGLSFNHIQLFANGTRLDNQSWDDDHDIGVSSVDPPRSFMDPIQWEEL